MAPQPTSRAGSSPDRRRIAVILKGYPRLSETFIAQELWGLEARGLSLDIHSLRQPYDPTAHPIHAEIRAGVNYLPEYLWRAPLRILRGWWRARRLPGYATAWRIFRRDLARDRTPNRIRRFGQACVLAADMSPDTGMLYAHFLHTPTSVARYAAIIRGLPFAVSAHAKDIWTTPDWEKAEKIADAEWVTTCTSYGADHLAGLADAPGKVRLHYHGLDVARFLGADAPPQANRRDCTVLIGSVGRLVEKKGYDDLLDALAALPGDLDWRLEHIGGGELASSMNARAKNLGIASRITWRGRKPQDEVRDLLERADLFVLASKIAADGDRDGLPNVLMEAQAMERACISTAVSAIPELIRDGETGLLVPERDPAALAAAIETLVRDAELRARIARAGAARVRAEFDLESGLDSIASALRDEATLAGRAAA